MFYTLNIELKFDFENYIANQIVISISDRKTPMMYFPQIIQLAGKANTATLGSLVRALPSRYKRLRLSLHKVGNTPSLPGLW